MYFKAVFIASAITVLAVTSAAAAQPASDAPAAPEDASQGPVATSDATASQDHVTKLLRDWVGSAPDPSTDRDGADDQPAPPDKAIHGEVGFGVGNHGYREAYGVATMPLGNHGSATVAVDETQSRAWGRGMNGHSLALSLAFGDAAVQAPPADQCYRRLTSDRYIDPLWSNGAEAQLQPRARSCK